MMAETLKSSIPKPRFSEMVESVMRRRPSLRIPAPALAVFPEMVESVMVAVPKLSIPPP